MRENFSKGRRSQNTWTTARHNAVPRRRRSGKRTFNIRTTKNVRDRSPISSAQFELWWNAIHPFVTFPEKPRLFNPPPSCLEGYPNIEEHEEGGETNGPVSPAVFNQQIVGLPRSPKAAKIRGPNFPRPPLRDRQLIVYSECRLNSPCHRQTVYWRRNDQRQSPPGPSRRGGTRVSGEPRNASLPDRVNAPTPPVFVIEQSREKERLGVFNPYLRCNGVG